MTTPLGRPSTETLCTWSASHIPHGTPMRHQVDATAPEIRLVIGDHDRIELNLDPMAAGEIVLTLRRAIRDFNAAHGFQPLDPEIP